MPIGINGSGTITGLSAGGLPDGIITTSEIANNAVTETQLSGGIVRAYYASSGTGVQVAGSTFVDLGLNFSNVVINAGETPIFFAHVTGRLVSGAQQHASLRLRYTGSATGTVGASDWGFGINVVASAAGVWFIHTVSGINLKQVRSNPFNSTGTFNFFVQGNTTDTVMFGGDTGNPTAAYGQLQATILIMKG